MGVSLAAPICLKLMDTSSSYLSILPLGLIDLYAVISFHYLGFCDSSHRSSKSGHKRTASLYRIALSLWYPIGFPRFQSRSLVLIDLLAHLFWVDTLMEKWQDQCLLLASLSLFNISSFLSLSFSNNLDLLLTSRAVDLPTLWLGLHSYSLLTFCLWILFPRYRVRASTSPCLEIVPF